MRFTAEEKKLLREWRWLRSHEERCNEFATMKKARLYARLETQHTGIKHIAFMTSGYRDMKPVFLYAVIPLETALRHNAA